MGLLLPENISPEARLQFEQTLSSMTCLHDQIPSPATTPSAPPQEVAPSAPPQERSRVRYPDLDVAEQPGVAQGQRPADRRSRQGEMKEEEEEKEKEEEEKTTGGKIAKGITVGKNCLEAFSMYFSVK